MQAKIEQYLVKNLHGFATKAYKVVAIAALTVGAFMLLGTVISALTESKALTWFGLGLLGCALTLAVGALIVEMCKPSWWHDKTKEDRRKICCEWKKSFIGSAINASRPALKWVGGVLLTFGGLAIIELIARMSDRGFTQRGEVAAISFVCLVAGSLAMLCSRIKLPK
jgi:hypothetical protein